MLKAAYIMGMAKAFTDAGLLSNRVPFEKVAQGAEIAANANPQEVQAIGSSIGPQDLESMMKILEVLSMLFDQYQQQLAMQGGGGMPPPPPPGGMPPPPPPPPGGMPPPPPPPPGGMPPPPPPPPGGMPPPPPGM